MAGVEVVSRRPDQSLHRTRYGEVAGAPAGWPARWSAPAWRAAIASATLMWNHAEHLEAYFGDPARRRRPPHPQPPPPPGRHRVHRQRRRRPLPVRRRGAAAALREGGRGRRAVRAGDRGRRRGRAVGADGRLRGVPRPARPTPRSPCSPSVTRSASATRAGRPVGPRAWSTPTARRSCTRIVSAMPDCAVAVALRHGACRSCRCSTSTPGGCRTPRRWSARGWCFPGPTSTPAEHARSDGARAGHVAAGVPTIWLGIREVLDAAPGQHTLQPGLRMIVGGSAAPEQLIRDFDRHGMTLLHAWGMTETSPIGLVARLPPEIVRRERGRAVRHARQAGRAAAAGRHPRAQRGRRGPPTTSRPAGSCRSAGRGSPSRYFGEGGSPERWTEDGWFRTGDVARVDATASCSSPTARRTSSSRAASGSASQELENALMGHPSVLEAAVVGVPHPRWSERPLAVVVLTPGRVGQRRPAARVPGPALPRSSGCPTRSCSPTRSRAPPPASSRRPSCASSTAAGPGERARSSSAQAVGVLNRLLHRAARLVLGAGAQRHRPGPRMEEEREGPVAEPDHQGAPPALAAVVRRLDPEPADRRAPSPPRARSRAGRRTGRPRCAVPAVEGRLVADREDGQGLELRRARAARLDLEAEGPLGARDVNRRWVGIAAADYQEDPRGGGQERRAGRDRRPELAQRPRSPPAGLLVGEAHALGLERLEADAAARLTAPDNGEAVASHADQYES